MLLVVFFSALVLATPSSAQRREFVGPGKCTDCHDHSDEKEWSEKRDGDGKGKLHLDALNQLEDSRSAAWGTAVGLKDVYDAGGACARCHATVVRGSSEFGVTCESCHGAGRDYLRPHQDKGAYAAAVALGMADVVKKPDTWARRCLACHVLGADAGDAALIQAGHPSGSQFDLSRKFPAIALHWTSKYEPRVIAATNIARGTPPPVAIAPVAAPPSQAPAPAAATPAAAPPLATTAPPVTSVRTEPAPARGTRPAILSVQTPSLPPTAERATPVPPVEADPVHLQTPAALVGSVQGRVVTLLESLLKAGVRTPVKLTPPATTTAYRGADAELLRLQEEVIALALEALGTAPPSKSPPRQQ